MPHSTQENPHFPMLYCTSCVGWLGVLGACSAQCPSDHLTPDERPGWLGRSARNRRKRKEKKRSQGESCSCTQTIRAWVAKKVCTQEIIRKQCGQSIRASGFVMSHKQLWHCGTHPLLHLVRIASPASSILSSPLRTSAAPHSLIYSKHAYLAQARGQRKS